MFWQGVSTLVQWALDINIKLYDLDIIFGLPGEEDVFQIIKILHSVWKEVHIRLSNKR